MGSFTTLHDDPSIPDEEVLYRAIPSLHIHDRRLSSGAFKSAKDTHVSVDRGSLSRPEETLSRHENYVGVAQINTGEVRNVTIGVASDPLPKNPAHALIIRNPQMNNSQWRKVARLLATACTWAIVP